MRIKTTTTEIECNAEELRQSNSASDAFYNMFRKAFNGPSFNYEPDEEETDGGNT